MRLCRSAGGSSICAWILALLSVVQQVSARAQLVYPPAGWMAWESFRTGVTEDLYVSDGRLPHRLLLYVYMLPSGCSIAAI
eukprot:COSAG02_NODE_1029_length_15083_cov_8.066271_2_plen_81_part_00